MKRNESTMRMKDVVSAQATTLCCALMLLLCSLPITPNAAQAQSCCPYITWNVSPDFSIGPCCFMLDFEFTGGNCELEKVRLRITTPGAEFTYDKPGPGIYSSGGGLGSDELEWQYDDGLFVIDTYYHISDFCIDAAGHTTINLELEFFDKHSNSWICLQSFTLNC